MNSIELLKNEHKYIMRMIKVIRSSCYEILKGKDIDYDDFRLIIDFIKNYSDDHHHKKEEKILFDEMLRYLGVIAEKTIRHGMLVEHEYGRMYVADLISALNRVEKGDEESKLDVIANAISYCHLLERHIDKEDRVIYTYAENNLSEDIMKKIDEDSKIYEEKSNKNINEYITSLKNLERKYGL